MSNGGVYMRWMCILVSHKVHDNVLYPLKNTKYVTTKMTKCFLSIFQWSFLFAAHILADLNLFLSILNNIYTKYWLKVLEENTPIYTYI